MSKYYCHIIDQNSDFAIFMAKITLYQPHSAPLSSPDLKSQFHPMQHQLNQVRYDVD